MGHSEHISVRPLQCAACLDAAKDADHTRASLRDVQLGYDQERTQRERVADHAPDQAFLPRDFGRAGADFRCVV